MTSWLVLNTSMGSSTLLSSCLDHDTTPAMGGAFFDSGGEPYMFRTNEIFCRLQYIATAILQVAEIYECTCTCTLYFSYVFCISSNSSEYLLNAVSMHLYSVSLSAARGETASNRAIISNALLEL